MYKRQGWGQIKPTYDIYAEMLKDGDGKENDRLKRSILELSLIHIFIKNRIGCPEDLRGFSWEGFTFDEGLSTDNHLQFVLELSLIHI